MGKDVKSEAVSQLFRAILTLQNEQECYQFFEDICTVNELLSLSQRLEVATMLREGKPMERLQKKQVLPLQQLVESVEH